MRILAIGDIVGKNGCEFLSKKLATLKSEKNIDLVIANGENSAEGNGITISAYKSIIASGVDIITSGNHVFKRYEIREVLKNNKNILRPLNYPRYTTPGHGFYKFNVKGEDLYVINLLGTVFMESLRCPYDTMDEVLKWIGSKKIIILDFHAEATAEKIALGFYLDGKISAMFGTHTHVQTSDERILPKGTGYITDIGMTGAINSVLGVNTEISIKRQRQKLPIKFINADGDCKLEGVIFDINTQSCLAEHIERIRII